MASFKRNRKADQSVVQILWQIAGVVLAAIIVWFLISFGVKLSGIFSNKPDQGTVKSFAELADTIEGLKAGEPPKMVNYYIANGFKVAGFNKGKNLVKDTCFRNHDEPIPGTKCGENACLVLCGETNGECNTKIKAEPRTYPEIEKFIVKDDLGSGGIFEGTKNFILYGGCGTSYWGYKPLYIQRVGNDIIFSLDGKDPVAEKKTKETMINLIKEVFETNVDLKLGLSNLCDSNKGIQKSFSSPIMGSFYDPKSLSPTSTTGCISGSDFAKLIDEAIGRNLGENKNIAISIYQNGEMILDYTEPGVELPYSGQYIFDSNFNIKLSYSPFGNTVQKATTSNSGTNSQGFSDNILI